MAVVIALSHMKYTGCLFFAKMSISTAEMCQWAGVMPNGKIPVLLALKAYKYIMQSAGPALQFLSDQ